MVGSGLRVDECLNLQWSDVRVIDRQKNVRQVDSGEILDDNIRYYLKINVSLFEN